MSPQIRQKLVSLGLIFGNWNSVYVRFSRWSDKQVWHKVFAVLREDADFEEVFLDSTVVRAHQHAAGAAKKR